MVPKAIVEALQASNVCEKVFGWSSISGGCLNNAYKVDTDKGDVFVKTNSDPNSLTMFEGESEALKVISEAVPKFAPKPLCKGLLPNGGAFLATVFVSLNSASTRNQQILFAKKLAQLHSATSHNRMFGFPVVTMCGTTSQDNSWEADWETFYKERRLRPMIANCLKNNSRDAELQRLGKIVVDKVVHHLLKDAEVKPALIHGDLWSGNWAIDSTTNEPVIFDPAACYGHSEMELSIMTMFGSPSYDFFKEYHTHHPRQEPFFEERQAKPTNVEDLNPVDKNYTGTEIVDSSEYVPVRFDSITAISPLTQKALKQEFGYETMSKVQDAVLSQSPIRGDLFVKAKTGTGKTLAFLIPAFETALQHLDPNDRTRHVSIFVISPTRELAQQIAQEAKRLSRFHPFEVHTLVGGEPKGRQMHGLMQRRVDVVVGTPGRLTDLLQSMPDFRNQCSGMKTLILDEADQLLEMGFRQDIENLMRYFPRDRQTFLFSATISPEIRKVASFALRKDYTFIDTVDPNDVNTNLQVKQSYAITPWEIHLKTIRNIVLDHRRSHPEGKIMMFLPTRKGTELYAEIFRITGDIEVFELQSGLNQQQRTRISDRFRKLSSDAMLVTSDVSARGVDYPGVTLVLQVGAASSREQYIHRLGRTGRAGREGEGVLVLAPFEKNFTNTIKDLPIKPLQVPEIKQDNRIQRAVETIDIEMVNDAFKAFLGYYMARADLLKIRKDSLLELGMEFCGAFGVTEMPRLPAKMTQSLGLGRSSLRGGGAFAPRSLGGFGGRDRQSSSRGGFSFGGVSEDRALRRPMGRDRQPSSHGGFSFGGFSEDRLPRRPMGEKEDLHLAEEDLHLAEEDLHLENKKPGRQVSRNYIMM
ncbi:1456_t:CDS:2 [Ambispora gerdemannii]|uniref:ATP-dependent RNA helicase n=1 Tax=Ambispora gerdemannii TaxID=144530 RepID=A0A9N9AL69_9GLOM|nr:1456_t:CDS:2 [Ambispora gerdemannii]